MLTKPNEREHAALRRLRNPELAPILEFLTRENSQVLGSLMHLQDETVLRQFQGKAQILHELLSLVQKLDRTELPKPPPGDGVYQQKPKAQPG